MLRRFVFGMSTFSRWLFIVIFVGWIISTIVVAFQGEWSKVGVGLAYVVGFGLFYFVIVPRGMQRLLQPRHPRPPESN